LAAPARPIDPAIKRYKLYSNYNLDESMQAGNFFGASWATITT